MLLAQVRDMIGHRSWQPVHVDVVVVAEAPRLTPHVPAMRAALADVLRLSSDSVNVKATTVEGMGAIGREEGIAAHAVASIRPLPPMRVGETG